MKSRAVLLKNTVTTPPYASSDAWEIVEVDLAAPGKTEVLVRIEAAGICHSDLSVMNGTRPRPYPIVLGHESAGIVAHVGSEVHNLKVGDHVTSIFLPSCGACSTCQAGVPANCSVAAAVNARGEMMEGGSRISLDGQPISHYNGVSCFSEYAVMDERSLVKIPEEIPFDLAALFGCALLTGIGAVRNSALTKPGQSVAVWGLGGVGLSAILGAVIAQASPIIAIDPIEFKRHLALSLGADIALDPSENLRDHLSQGVEVAIEAVGRASSLKAAYEATARGGVTVTVGLPPASEQLSISALSLVVDVKTIKGSYVGSANPRVDIPEYVKLWSEGKLPVERLLSLAHPMSKVGEAMDLLDSAQVVRQVIHPHAL
ncbi:MAG: alcohol dehydrogenase catalytic domain-containing protein [Actinobacteria bacterium]|nr:alcohol dehydrogenase catalytic domain-containing protein [Actinomycetota bacterium]